MSLPVPLFLRYLFHVSLSLFHTSLFHICVCIYIYIRISLFLHRSLLVLPFPFLVTDAWKNGSRLTFPSRIATIRRRIVDARISCVRSRGRSFAEQKENKKELLISRGFVHRRNRGLRMGLFRLLPPRL